jgi:hypothetical protein
MSRAARKLLDGLRIEDVGLVEREVRMLAQVGSRERVAMQVVERDDLVVVEQLPREGRGDEPGAAGDEDALAAQHGIEFSRVRLPFRLPWSACCS